MAFTFGAFGPGSFASWDRLDAILRHVFAGNGPLPSSGMKKQGPPPWLMNTVGSAAAAMVSVARLTMTSSFRFTAHF